MKKIIVFHPILYSLYPLVFYYYHNSGEFHPDIIIAPLLVILIIVLLIYQGLRIIIGNKYKAGLMTTAVSLFFFTYGHALNLLKQQFVNNVLVTDNIFFPAWIIFLGLIVFLILKYRTPLKKISLVLNLLSVVLLMMPVFGIFRSLLKTGVTGLSVRPAIPARQASAQKSGNSNNLPDIYYIIAERYPSTRSLKDYFQFDNSSFIKFLEENGFYVAQDSKSNYLITYLSLASSLNMDYLGDFIKSVPTKSTDKSPIIKLIQDNNVVKYLKNKGYLYIHIGAPWLPMQTSKYADVVFDTDSAILINEFMEGFKSTTLIYPITKILAPNQESKTRNDHRLLINDQINFLIKTSSLPGPKFVFAHMFLTHPPYVYDRSGNLLTETQFRKLNSRENKVQNTEFANLRYRDILRKLLTGSKTEPIIILQSDEGEYFERLNYNVTHFDLRMATLDELKQKSFILNAYYIPKKYNVPLYQSITPVNTFRLLFNDLFNDQFTLLPDKVFGHRSFWYPYVHFDITEKVKIENTQDTQN
ncbi:hypothetical protein A2154_00465 [Candidatus Gottesmanbacteria bacterium RBG_16_43_7]|uniref:Sulfatase N-terminal domain-containing protein n=1 Tax=Candidatus Gottesmanbacteria bacterium RBG_16_43_7 TaxID=1798373 RepID=A0A1F5ZBD7_9BACT|nr:MAG: hypothetical protein A2154_00465 [Candidatus Gottesmanbacteria bacterium RBG_16_43_7]